MAQQRGETSPDLWRQLGIRTHTQLSARGQSDVWRSQEELSDFLTNRLGPAAAKLGLPEATSRFAQLHDRVFLR